MLIPTVRTGNIPLVGIVLVVNVVWNATQNALVTAHTDTFAQTRKVCISDQHRKGEGHILVVEFLLLQVRQLAKMNSLPNMSKCMTRMSPSCPVRGDFCRLNPGVLSTMTPTKVVWEKA